MDIQCTTIIMISKDICSMTIMCGNINRCVLFPYIYIYIDSICFESISFPWWTSRRQTCQAKTDLGRSGWLREGATPWSEANSSNCSHTCNTLTIDFGQIWFCAFFLGAWLKLIQREAVQRLPVRCSKCSGLAKRFRGRSLAPSAVVCSFGGKRVILSSL